MDNMKNSSGKNTKQKYTNEKKTTLDLKEKFIDDLDMMQTMASLYVEMDGNGKWMDTADFF